MALQFEYAGRDHNAAELPSTGTQSIVDPDGSVEGTIVVTPNGGGYFSSDKGILTRAEVPDFKIDKETAQLRLFSRVDVLNTIHVLQPGGSTKQADVWTTELSVQYWPDELELPELKLHVKGVQERIASGAAAPY